MDIMFNNTTPNALITKNNKILMRPITGFPYRVQRIEINEDVKSVADIYIDDDVYLKDVPTDWFILL